MTDKNKSTNSRPDEVVTVDGHNFWFGGSKLKSITYSDSEFMTGGTSLRCFLPDMTVESFLDFCEKWDLDVRQDYDMDPDGGYEYEAKFAYYDHSSKAWHMVTIYDRNGSFRIGGHSNFAIRIVSAMGLHGEFDYSPKGDR